MSALLLVGSVLLNLAIRGHAYLGGNGGSQECMLQPSELGQDWYKVPQPSPMGYDHDPGYEPSYIHMPCAPTTVFELTVCGCTNLLSFIFTSVGGGGIKKPVADNHHKIHPGDLVKSVDLKPIEPTGSMVINTRTGEVRKCPFRASSRGAQWYLVREPGDIWRPMQCAAATLFDKIACTCIHQALASRDPSKPEDKDIVILEEGFDTFGSAGDNTISKSLGITLQDVDFGLDRDIPFWRQGNHGNAPSVVDNGIGHIKSDVPVTLNHFAHTAVDPRQYDILNSGTDRISDGHRALLMKLRDGPSPFNGKKQRATPLVMDRRMKAGAGMMVPATDQFGDPVDLALNVDWSLGKGRMDNGHSDNGHGPEPGARRKHTKRNTQPGRRLNNAGNSEIRNGEQPHFGGQVLSNSDNGAAAPTKLRTMFGPNAELNALSNVLSDISAQIVTKQEVNNNGDVKRDNGAQNGGATHPVQNSIFQNECMKKPMPWIDPHYFLLPVPGIGYIPYTCHGNYIYDHSICACKRAPGETSYNEGALPVKECNKKAIPEFGAQFFQTHILGFGYIPIGCHGSTQFDQTACACV